MEAMPEPAAPAIAVATAGETRVSAPAAAAAHDAIGGAALVTTNCASCHQATGEGLPHAFPPLQGSAAVSNDDATKHMHVMLRRLHGLTIAGVGYGSSMPRVTRGRWPACA